MTRVQRAVSVALLALSLATAAQANGRFPQANYLVLGPGRRNDLIVLRATFGLVLSRDHGAHWDWVCEESLDAVGTFDPSLALGSDQRIAMGLPTGMRTSSVSHCAWSSPTGAAESVIDITQDALGDVMFAAGTDYSMPTALTRVYRSDDRGLSWRVTATQSSYIVETLDVAPGAPQRVYLSGYRPGAVGTLLRSDDGGMTFRATSARFPELSSVWIAAVHPTIPDRLWLRVAAGLGTELHRSDDGGATTVRVAQTSEPMDGFALSDDGDTVWYGTGNRAQGIHRSVRGGAFTRVASAAAVRCMRFHGGLLFVCGDEAIDGYSLAWSGDGGDTLNPLMSLRDLRGPLRGCTEDGGVSSACGPVWTQLAPQLQDLDAATVPPRVPLPAVDAGVIDASVADVPRDGAAIDAPTVDRDALDGDARVDHPAPSPDLGAPEDVARPTDLGLRDVTPPRDLGAPPGDAGGAGGRGACDCHAGAPARHRWWLSLGLVGLAARRRRRSSGRR
jgi:hypothetical protein